jgi:hypothetical protein
VLLFSGELTEWEHLRPRFRLEDGWTFPEKVSFAHNDHVDTIFRTIFKLYMRKDPRLPVQSKVLLLQLIELIMNETIFAAFPKSSPAPRPPGCAPICSPRWTRKRNGQRARFRHVCRSTGGGCALRTRFPPVPINCLKVGTRICMT